MAEKQEGAPQPHPHTVMMWVVGLIVAISIGLLGLFFKASAQTRTTDNVIVGTDITGHADISVTTSPDQRGDVVGAESVATGCPGSISQGQTIMGTRVGPTGDLHVTMTTNGGSGSVTGFRSSAIAGGSGCK